MAAGIVVRLAGKGIPRSAAGASGSERARKNEAGALGGVDIGTWARWTPPAGALKRRERTEGCEQKDCRGCEPGVSTGTQCANF